MSFTERNPSWADRWSDLLHGTANQNSSEAPFCDQSYDCRLYRLKKGSCEVDIAPFAVFLNEDKQNYAEPDICVICDTEKLSEKGCTGAPDWIIEIVSPGSRKMDYFTKLFKYRTAGVREYWIVDPGKNLILVYNFDTSDSEQYTFADTVKAGIYEDLYIDFANLK